MFTSRMRRGRLKIWQRLYNSGRSSVPQCRVQSNGWYGASDETSCFSCRCRCHAFRSSSLRLFSHYELHNSFENNSRCCGTRGISIFGFCQKEIWLQSTSRTNLWTAWMWGLLASRRRNIATNLQWQKSNNMPITSHCKKSKRRDYQIYAYVYTLRWMVYPPIGVQFFKIGKPGKEKTM